MPSTPDPQFHGDFGRQIGAMAVLEERINDVRESHAGRPVSEVLAELRRIHDEMGIELVAVGGEELARHIANSTH